MVKCGIPNFSSIDSRYLLMEFGWPLYMYPCDRIMPATCGGMIISRVLDVVRTIFTSRFGASVLFCHSICSSIEPVQGKLFFSRADKGIFPLVILKVFPLKFRSPSFLFCPFRRIEVYIDIDPSSLPTQAAFVQLLHIDPVLPGTHS